MNDIICPNCQKVFKIDEAGFADILKQVRDHKFQEELQARLDLAEQEKENAVKLAEANLNISLQADLANKDKEILQLKATSERNLSEKLAGKDSLLTEMKAKLANAEIEKRLSVSEAVQKVVKERDDLINDIKLKDAQKQLSEKSLSEKHTVELKAKDEIRRGN